MSTTPPPVLNFIQHAIKEDLASGRFTEVVTRFPPHPNGYLHIGHAKAICVSFNLAAEFGGRCNLRFDDTNPVKESVEYVQAIQDDIRWLGFDWGDGLHFASDYFPQLYEWAQRLVRDGKAYVCELNADEIRETRGTLTEPGTDSPFRDRAADESLDLLEKMRAGEFPEGSRTLRARIDMAAPNLNLRDPVMYRILHTAHHRTGDSWHIYPIYDWAHGQSDSIEGVSHSLCSLEFQNHRPLYDWYVEQLGIHHPRQIEFARLNLSHTIVTKRVLRELVEEKIVRGWDDPRMPTLRAMRRRGYPPSAIRAFCDRIGVARDENLIEMALLEYLVREELNRTAPRVMGVLRPLKVVIENCPEDAEDGLEIPVNPEDAAAGHRTVPFSRELWIEDADFLEDPPRKYFRLGPDREVRLRGGYFIKYVSHSKDADGKVTEVRCTYDPETRSGQAPDGRRPSGTIHWVSARHAVPAEVRLYRPLFTTPNPRKAEDGGDWRSGVSADSLEVLADARVEPHAATYGAGEVMQFERLGYFAADPDSTPGRPVFNRTVTLRDTWAKQSGGGQKGGGAPGGGKPPGGAAGEPGKKKRSRRRRNRDS
ncbi:MAG: glutamine--tRNA ligase/YqeY domain fusion protein [Gemmatimonadetes bacterium]|nr:glutamine--tRNA ligase/YqeY domain fusion protein [Gemmatimonadota bacterium]